jgi:hypothetical protein
MHTCPKFKVPVLLSARAQPPGKVLDSAPAHYKPVTTQTAEDT